MLQWIKNLLCGKEIDGLKHLIELKIKELDDCCRNLDAARNERDANEKRAKDAEHMATRFQEQIDDILRDEPIWKKATNGLLKQVSERRPHMVAYVHGPDFSTIETKELRAVEVRASVMLYLDDVTPPELIAEEISEKVKDTILSKWRNQSILNWKRGAR